MTMKVLLHNKIMETNKIQAQQPEMILEQNSNQIKVFHPFLQWLVESMTDLIPLS